MYPHQTMLDNVQIDVASYAMIKVDIIHKNLKDLKLGVPLDDTTLTMRDAIIRRVRWRRTFINVDPSAATLASTTTSQPNTASALIFPETRLSPSPIQEQSRPSPPRTQSTLLPAADQT
jgi:hypothetical protein